MRSHKCVRCKAFPIRVVSIGTQLAPIYPREHPLPGQEEDGTTSAPLPHDWKTDLLDELPTCHGTSVVLHPLSGNGNLLQFFVAFLTTGTNTSTTRTSTDGGRK